MKVGDRVVCVKVNPKKHLVKGAIYTINYIHECCGRISYDVGVERWNGSTRCASCKKPIERSLFISWFFAPLQYNSAHDELINIVEERIDQPEKVEI